MSVRLFDIHSIVLSSCLFVFRSFFSCILCVFLCLENGSEGFLSHFLGLLVRSEKFVHTILFFVCEKMWFRAVDVVRLARLRIGQESVTGGLTRPTLGVSVQPAGESRR